MFFSAHLLSFWFLPTSNFNETPDAYSTKTPCYNIWNSVAARRDNVIIIVVNI